ncbi:hypothetical protein LTR84_007955 [Exophiala bonariae]|uniref:Uncharacterized protein n=1 Tax=Exophiala bonariae TaxID=1690606 RepID=A0AAV9NLJ4_9EURO|nr:hypothetical protein LTR84_007955 [Exophiala bonariae]
MATPSNAGTDSVVPFNVDEARVRLARVPAPELASVLRLFHQVTTPAGTKKLELIVLAVEAETREHYARFSAEALLAYLRSRGQSIDAASAHGDLVTAVVRLECQGEMMRRFGAMVVPGLVDELVLRRVSTRGAGRTKWEKVNTLIQFDCQQQGNPPLRPRASQPRPVAIPTMPAALASFPAPAQLAPAANVSGGPGHNTVTPRLSSVLQPLSRLAIDDPADQLSPRGRPWPTVRPAPPQASRPAPVPTAPKPLSLNMPMARFPPLAPPVIPASYQPVHRAPQPPGTFPSAWPRSPPLQQAQILPDEPAATPATPRPAEDPSKVALVAFPSPQPRSPLLQQAQLLPLEPAAAPAEDPSTLALATLSPLPITEHTPRADQLVADLSLSPGGLDICEQAKHALLRGEWKAFAPAHFYSLEESFMDTIREKREQHQDSTSALYSLALLHDVMDSLGLQFVEYNESHVAPTSPPLDPPAVDRQANGMSFVSNYVSNLFGARKALEPKSVEQDQHLPALIEYPEYVDEEQSPEPPGQQDQAEGFEEVTDDGNGDAQLQITEAPAVVDTDEALGEEQKSEPQAKDKQPAADEYWTPEDIEQMYQVLDLLCSPSAKSHFITARKQAPNDPLLIEVRRVCRGQARPKREDLSLQDNELPPTDMDIGYPKEWGVTKTIPTQLWNKWKKQYHN